MSFSQLFSNRYFYKLACGKLQLVSYALLGCLFLYAFKGSPTPDNPSVIEIIIALLIISSIGVSGSTNVFSVSNNKNNNAYVLFLIFGLTVPVFVGLSQDADLLVMARDIVAFLLLCLPIFLFYNLKNHKEFNDSLFIGVTIIAVIFSARVVFNNIPFVEKTDELLYLANSPIVLFFAIYFIGTAYRYLFCHKNLKKFFLAIFMFIISAIILLAMVQDVQRATLLAVFISLIFFILDSFIKKPVSSIIPLAFMAILIFYNLQVIETIFTAIESKTSLVGFNSRYQELYAVWEEVEASPLKILFGLGWGARFESPALGGLNASFTHSLLSYMLLKTGVIGLFLTFLYCTTFAVQIFNIFIKNRIVGIALFWSFVIPIFLYASYKSFDFGLLLTLIMAFGLYYSNNEKTLSSDY